MNPGIGAGSRSCMDLVFWMYGRWLVRMIKNKCYRDSDTPVLSSDSRLAPQWRAPTSTRVLTVVVSDSAQATAALSAFFVTARNWKTRIMDWVPIVFVIFKLGVLCTGMFYAIKWHYDQGKKEKEKGKERRAVLRGAVTVIVIFLVLLVGLGVVTYDVAKMFGLELTFP